MRIERQTVGTVDVLAPVGALVDDDALKFRRQLKERFKGGTPRVVLDMHEVPYLDSEALEALLDAADELAGFASSLKLAGVTSTCREVFELAGLSSKFRFFNDVSDAVKSYL